MPLQDPAGLVEYVVVAQTGPGILWEWTSNGSRWVHWNFIINVPPKINTHFVTTFSTPEKEALITVSLSINRSSHLVRFYDEISYQLLTTYPKIFYPIVTNVNKRCSILVQLVSVNLSIAEMFFFLAVFLPNGMVNDGVFNCRGKFWNEGYIKSDFLVFYSLAICSSLLILFGSTVLLAFGSILLLIFWCNYFSRFLFNFFACFNCLDLNYAFILLLFVVSNMKIFLKIFLSTIIFLLWSYTITINCNVCNVL